MIDKPYIGDDARPIRAEDIQNANRMMYVSSTMMLLLALALRAAVIWLGGGFA
jgi:cobalamin biosynthesis protein CobD/CbiB